MILSFYLINFSFSFIWFSNLNIFSCKFLTVSVNYLFYLYLFFTSLNDVSTFLIISYFDVSNYFILLVSSSTSPLWADLILSKCDNLLLSSNSYASKRIIVYCLCWFWTLKFFISSSRFFFIMEPNSYYRSLIFFSFYWLRRYDARTLSCNASF